MHYKAKIFADSHFFCTFVAVKRNSLLIAITVTLLMSTSASGENLDSLVLSRVYSFKQSHAHDLSGFSTNVYMRYLYQTHKRNATLWAVPSMYVLARGKRAFVSESYGRFIFNDVDNYENLRQVYYTTIPRNRRAMPVLLEYVTPDIYDVTIHSDHVLSPFNRENKSYYRYSTTQKDDSTALLTFRPRFIRNTQLIKGSALIDLGSGRVKSAEIEGEFDMIHFKTNVTMGEEGARAFLPHSSETHVEFKFLGNRISSRFVTMLDCPITLPDTLRVKGDRHLIDSLRPVPLNDEERFIYDSYDHQHKSKAEEPDTLERDTTINVPEDAKKRKHNYLKEIGWDIIGGNLLHSLRASSENGYVKLSPIINPQYISYSHRKGFSYKIKLGARYNFSPSSRLELNPRIGYNFKQREFYWNVPLRFCYNDSLDAHIELVWGNDNRIANNGVLDEIMEEQGERPELADKGLDIFDDRHLSLRHSISPCQWLMVETGLVYHSRHALNAKEMRAFGKPTTFHSIAPSLGVKIRPWANAPLLSIDYERGIKVNNVDMTYERWEADISAKQRLSRMQTLNLRLGGGLYTRKDKNYFMDFSNFRDENLPEGWDDDWSGNFQLLSSRLYNSSKYYIRGNISYESPLLVASMVPLLGRYVERERLYHSSLLLSHSQLYSELGYSFTCRYASVAVFASFKNTHYNEMGCKFTFELFRRW